MSALAWRIYYDDGSTFSSTSGPPHAAPPCGVQAIVQADPIVGRYVIWGRDFYYFEDGHWQHADHFGLWDYLCRPGAEKVVRFGRNMVTEHFRALLRRVTQDPDFPPKSGWYPGEEGIGAVR